MNQQIRMNSHWSWDLMELNVTTSTGNIQCPFITGWPSSASKLYFSCDGIKANIIN